MPFRAICTSDKQLPLPLEPLANPTHEFALRTAYRRLEISRSLSLEQAMRDAAYAIGIRNLAEAMARRTQNRLSQPLNCDGAPWLYRRATEGRTKNRPSHTGRTP